MISSLFSHIEPFIESIFKEAIETETRGIEFGNFQVLRDTFAPSVLLELGSITNPEDEALLQTEEFHVLASGQMVQGIMDYQEDWNRVQHTIVHKA